MRECLVDGPVAGASLNEFYKTRAEFIASNYNGENTNAYYEKSVSQIERLTTISDESEVNLWFEDDLFCQVNFWFTCHILYTHHHPQRSYLIRPDKHTRYGFGAFDLEGLLILFEKRILLPDLKLFSNLWLAYQANDHQKLVETGSLLPVNFAFVNDAIQAQLDRDSPEKGPKAILNQIIAEFGTDNFGIVFREFSKRAPIYGFGDLQVKQLMNQLAN